MSKSRSNIELTTYFNNIVSNMKNPNVLGLNPSDDLNTEIISLHSTDLPKNCILKFRKDCL